MTIQEKFKNITGYDISTYFDMFTDFVANYYQNVIDYYSGNGAINQDSILALNKLDSETRKVSNMFDSNSRNMNQTMEFWDLLERFENVKVKVNTIKNSSKWLRSSIEKGNYTGGVSFNYIQSQGEFFENIANKVGYNDPQNQWANIALNNNVIEEDYTKDGGCKMSLTLQNNAVVFIDSVVDNLTGKKIYGKDLNKEVLFENGDLKVLGYDDTIKQSFDILLSTTKGSVPQFPLDGIDKSAFVGQNLNSVAFPSIFRQLVQLFRKDDTFKDISILNVIQEEDAMLIELSVKTRLDEILTNTLAV